MRYIGRVQLRMYCPVSHDGPIFTIIHLFIAVIFREHVRQTSSSGGMRYIGQVQLTTYFPVCHDGPMAVPFGPTPLHAQTR